MPEKNIFSVVDYRGKTVVFTKKKWQEKQSDHPELHKKAFINCLKRTIEDPEEVWQDYQDKKNKRCYYRKYSSSSYAKVVVWIRHSPCSVVTAYEISDIKESRYSDLKKIL
ncbi:MAG: PBECR2 nuclease fold domain-containing protein [bacterium]|nr:PBECR2 nuclease fold domain-containing protein [bacterium]